MTVQRVLLVDDHALVRAGLRGLVDAISGFQVVGEAGDAGDLARLVEQLRPHVVLMDISLPGTNGIDATRQLTKLRHHPRVLVLSMHADREYVRQALLAGASGYLLKGADVDELRLALAAVTAGKDWISPAVAQAAIEDMTGPAPAIPRKRLDSLTPRQREVLQLIAEGQSTKQVARRLQISVKTVETHRAQIMHRLDIRHIAGLVRFAIRAGIVPPEQSGD